MAAFVFQAATAIMLPENFVFHCLGHFKMYLWLKLFHIFFIVSWFAGLFYLPRIYVNLAMAQQPQEYARLLLMAQRLYKFMRPWALGSLLCGVGLLWVQFGFQAAWAHGKLLIGGVLAGYHIYCGYLLRDFEQQRNTRSHKWYRVFNELPVFLLIFALYLIIFKPF